MTPLDVAIAIQRSTFDPSRPIRDPETGLYILDGTVPPTEVTLADYERGMRVLELREKAVVGGLR